jgi:hypothetical protein
MTIKRHLMEGMIDGKPFVTGYYLAAEIDPLLARVRAVLEKLINDCYEHNSEYHYNTQDETFAIAHELLADLTKEGGG